MATEEAIAAALGRGQVIDMTTTSRESGQPRRVEIVFHNIGGRIYVSGIPFPNRRSWLANLDANPHLTFHLMGKVHADLPATARIIDDEAEREPCSRTSLASGAARTSKRWSSRAL